MGCAGFQHCCQIIPPLLPRLQKENEKGDLPILLDFLCLHAPQAHPSLPAHNNRPCHHQPAALWSHRKSPVNHPCAGKPQIPKGELWGEWEHTTVSQTGHLWLPEEALYRRGGLHEWYLMAVQGERHRALLAFPQAQPDSSLLHHGL